MAKYTIANDYTLPSLGKLYGLDNRVIKLRSMTTNDEMIRCNSTDRPYKVMCDIIDDCIVGGYPVSSYDMVLGDYQYLLHRLRVVTYGPNYKSASMCTHCLSENQTVLNLDEIPVNTYTEDVENLRSIQLPVSEHTIFLNYQTPRMRDEVAIKVKEQKRKTPQMKFNPEMLFTLTSLINTVDGERYDPVKLEKFVRDLPMRDTNKILRKATELNEAIGIKTEIEYQCSVCGLYYKSTFRQSGEFFGPTDDD